MSLECEQLPKLKGLHQMGCNLLRYRVSALKMQFLQVVSCSVKLLDLSVLYRVLAEIFQKLLHIFGYIRFKTHDFFRCRMGECQQKGM